MCNCHLKEHLQLALENVPVFQLEREPGNEDGSRKRRKKKPAKQEQVLFLRTLFFPRTKLQFLGSNDISAGQRDVLSSHLSVM